MVKRRRSADRGELVQLLVVRGLDQDTTESVLDALTDLAGHPVEHLVRVPVDTEEV